MDLFYFILIWLKTILEHLRSITSFVNGNFLPDIEDEKEHEKDDIFIKGDSK